jgi:hypothetical protein
MDLLLRYGNVQANIMSVCKDHKDVSEYMSMCDEYAYSLPIPNIEGVEEMGHKIYMMLCEGKQYSEIKETLKPLFERKESIEQKSK